MPITTTGSSLQEIALTAEECERLGDINAQIGAMRLIYIPHCVDNPNQNQIVVDCRDQRNGITVRQNIERTDIDNQCIGDRTRFISYKDFEIELSLGNISRFDIMAPAYDGEMFVDGDYEGIEFVNSTGNVAQRGQLILEDLYSDPPRFVYHFYNVALESDSIEVLLQKDTPRDVSIMYRAYEHPRKHSFGNIRRLRSAA